MLSAPICVITYSLLSSMCRDMPVFCFVFLPTYMLPVCMCRDMLTAPICVVTYILLSSMCRDMPVLLDNPPLPPTLPRLSSFYTANLSLHTPHPLSTRPPCLSLLLVLQVSPNIPKHNPPYHKSALSLSLSICSKSFSCHSILCQMLK